MEAGVIMEQEAKREFAGESVSDAPVSAELQSFAPAMQPATEETVEAAAMKKQATAMMPEDEPLPTAMEPPAPGVAADVAPESASESSTDEIQGSSAQVKMEEDVADESNSPDRYRKELAEILELVEAGRLEEANAQLAALREACPRCDFPDSPADISIPE